MSSGGAQPATATATDSSNGKKAQSTEYELKKYLLLLATLVATVTYAAGLNLPGGSWLEDSPAEGRVAGDSILRHTNYTRYIVFYYFNAISFAASLLVGLLLLILHQDGGGWLLLGLVRSMMVVDLFGLMGAYGVGSSHDRFTTTCAACLLAFGIAAAFGAIALPAFVLSKTEKAASGDGAAGEGNHNNQPHEDDKKLKNLETLLVLAIFAATVAYVAGLNPPGGFWRSTEAGHHTAGEPVLMGLHHRRYKAFFFLNTTAFVASLLATMLIVSYDRLQDRHQRKIPMWVRKVVLYGPIVVALLSLAGAYAFGSCRDSRHTTYIVVLLVFFAAASILLQVIANKFQVELISCGNWIRQQLEKPFNKCSGTKDNKMTGNAPPQSTAEDPLNPNRASLLDDNRKSDKSLTTEKAMEKAREEIQLLAILAATIAYQAGVDPPGGVWVGSGEGHKVGDPILLTTHPVRYKIFYSNSAAFVASLVIMVMLQSKRLVAGNALKAAMILDLFGLIGAYATGSARETSTSVYTVALAGVVLIYVVIHIVFTTLDTTTTTNPQDAEDRLLKRRDVLLLLSVLGATLAYQAGLTPPGGLWEEDDKSGHHRAGFPVLLDKYPIRYKVFYYFNAASFMASVALIVLLLNPNLYKPGIQCYALYVCMIAGMFGLMGAYSAGSSMHLRTSIVVLALASALAVASFAVAIYVRGFRDKGPSPGGGGGGGGGVNNQRKEAKVEDEETQQKGKQAKVENEETKKGKEDDAMIMYLMLVGILGGSVTYLTGLKPPGGMWRDDGNGHSAAGYPVLYDTNKTRYNAFFYSNSVSFTASIAIIASLLCRMMAGRNSSKSQRIHLWPMHTAMVLDMFALLGAYAAGSARKWGTSTKVVLLLVPTLLLIWGVLFLCNKCQQCMNQRGNKKGADSPQTPPQPQP